MHAVDRFRRCSSGFTLLEVAIVLALIGLLLALASPELAHLLDRGRYKKTARDFVSSLREARSRAVGKNLEHRVEFDLDASSYRLTHGNRPTNSTASSWDDNVVFGWLDLPSGQVLRANETCNVAAGVVDIHLNPDGSGESQYICLLDNESAPRFRIGIPHSATGQVVLARWDSDTEQWDQ